MDYNSNNYGSSNRLIAGFLLIKRSPKNIIFFLISLIPSLIGLILFINPRNIMIFLISAIILVDIYFSFLTGIIQLFIPKRIFLKNENSFGYWFLLIIELFIYLTMCTFYFLF